MTCAGHRIARILLESALKKRSRESQVPAKEQECRDECERDGEIRRAGDETEP